MDISRDDAARALSDIAQTEGRSYALQGYRISGPILMVWGVIWLVCYVAMGVLPQGQWGLAWIPADIIGIIASIVMGRRARKPGRAGDAGTGWRIGGFALLICIFSSAIFAMFRPTDANVYMAFPGVLAGTIYATIGLWRMTRFLWIGAAMIAFSLVGYFFFPEHLAFWMAATGGGGLIIGGLLVGRA